MDLNKIKPKIKAESDKYSWNLYKFLRKIHKDKHVKNQMRIYWNHHSRIDGEWLPFTEKIPNTMQIVIAPYGDKSCGYFMSSVLMKGNCELFSLCAWKEDDFRDITDWFFKTYEDIGRCIFDGNHSGWLLGDENRFTYINNTRRCNWCGEWHHMEIHKETTIKRRKVWSV